MKQEKKQKQVHPKKIEESLSYTVEVRDKEGRIIQRVSAPSRSYVQQWNQILNIQMAQVNETVKDIEGTDITVKPAHSNLNVAAFPRGIRIGKGTTAVAITDYALETPLGEGTGLDEFNHQATTFTEPAVVGSTCSFTMKRIIINNSGATISGIKEIGCYIIAWQDPSPVFSFLGFRDILPSAVYVPHGGSITVTYTIAVTV